MATDDVQFKAVPINSWSEFYERAVTLALATRVHPDQAAALIYSPELEKRLGPLPTAPWYLKDPMPDQKSDLLEKARLEDELAALQDRLEHAGVGGKAAIIREMDDLIEKIQIIKKRL